MDKTVEKKIREAEEAAKEVELIKMLTKEFPDLKIHTNRWGHKRYSATSANPRVDKVEFGFNCGCCKDSPLEAWPYLETMGVKVYSDPTGIVVGERCDDYDNYRAVVERGGWFMRCEKYGISKVAIARIESYLGTSAPVYRDDDEDEDEED